MTRSGVLLSSAAISAGSGSRPFSRLNSRWTRRMRPSSSTRWTGSRMVRDWSAMERVMACLIHQVAYVENLKPLA